MGPISGHLDQPSLVNIHNNGLIISFKSKENGGRKRKKGLFSYLSLLGLVPLSLADSLLSP